MQKPPADKWQAVDDGDRQLPAHAAIHAPKLCARKLPRDEWQPDAPRQITRRDTLPTAARINATIAGSSVSSNNNTRNAATNLWSNSSGC